MLHPEEILAGSRERSDAIATGGAVAQCTDLVFGERKPLAQHPTVRGDDSASGGEDQTSPASTYSMVAGTVMMLPLVPFGWSSLAHASGAGWAGAVYLGLVPSALGFVLWGLQHRTAICRAVSRGRCSLQYALLYAMRNAMLRAWLSW